jgi:hypothetical protein
MPLSLPLAEPTFGVERFRRLLSDPEAQQLKTLRGILGRNADCDLRCEAEYRSGPLLARGYRFLRRLHEQDPLAFYTTVIYEGNAPELSALRGARGGLPEYRAFGRLRTPAIRLDRNHGSLDCGNFAIARATPDQLPLLIDFLNERLATRQFAPAYTIADMQGGRLSGLRVENVLLAMRRGRPMEGSGDAAQCLERTSLRLGGGAG